VNLNLENHRHTEAYGGTGPADGPRGRDGGARRGGCIVAVSRYVSKVSDSLSLTVGTSALVLHTRKSNKAENYRAYIFC